jgi:nucleoside-diphosphate-sugar epimerase
MSTKNTVLVAGVHGVTGRAAAEHWASLPGTKVYGLSRRSDPIRADVEGPLRFPGTEKTYAVLNQVTSAEILAKATGWAGESEMAKNEVFNITNGDYFHWRYLWPRIAAMFEMPPADPIPTPLTVYMADKKPVWEAMVRKHGLQPPLRAGFVGP